MSTPSYEMSLNTVDNNESNASMSSVYNANFKEIQEYVNILKTAIDALTVESGVSESRVIEILNESKPIFNIPVNVFDGQSVTIDNFLITRKDYSDNTVSFTITDNEGEINFMKKFICVKKYDGTIVYPFIQTTLSSAIITFRHKSEIEPISGNLETDANIKRVFIL